MSKPKRCISDVVDALGNSLPQEDGVVKCVQPHLKAKNGNYLPKDEEIILCVQDQYGMDYVTTNGTVVIERPNAIKITTNADGALVFTICDPNGNPVSMWTETDAQVSGNATTGWTITDDSGDTITIPPPSNSMITDNGNGTYDHDDGTGMIVTIDVKRWVEACPSQVTPGPGNGFTHIGADGTSTFIPFPEPTAPSNIVSGQDGVWTHGNGLGQTTTFGVIRQDGSTLPLVGGLPCVGPDLQRCVGDGSTALQPINKGANVMIESLRPIHICTTGRSDTALSEPLTDLAVNTIYWGAVATATVTNSDPCGRPMWVYYEREVILQMFGIGGLADFDTEATASLLGWDNIDAGNGWTITTGPQPTGGVAPTMPVGNGSQGIQLNPKPERNGTSTSWGASIGSNKKIASLIPAGQSYTYGIQSGFEMDEFANAGDTPQPQVLQQWATPPRARSVAYFSVFGTTDRRVI